MIYEIVIKTKIKNRKKIKKRIELWIK